jgi:cytochrome c biogenesis protein CcdA
VAPVLRLIGIVLSIGLADSFDPTTLGPGLYLSLGERPARRVLQFTVGVFVVMVLGGLAIVLGPGQLLLHLVPHPRRLVRHWIELSVGVALIIGAGVVWRSRRSLSERELFRVKERSGRRSSFWLGLGVMTLNLPVAFPYFAAIAAIIGSGRNLPSQVGAIVLYSLCFVSPLIGIVMVLWLLPERSGALLERIRMTIQRHWARALALLLICAGLFITALGFIGLLAPGHTHFLRLGVAVSSPLASL